MAQGPMVLIIDDSATSCHVMETILQNAGYQVKSVGDGREGLKAILREPPRCVVLDVVLPGMSGFEVCRHLRANDLLQGLPVIMVSTKSTPLDKAWALRQGATHYLVKPFADKVFAQLVKESVINYIPPGSKTAARQPRVAHEQDTAAIPSYMKEFSPVEHYATHAKIPAYRQMGGTSSGARNDAAARHRPPVHKLIPLRNQIADVQRKNNFLLASNDSIRKLYEAIDGKSDIEALCAVTRLSREDVMKGLRSLLTRRWIHLREPNGNIIRS